jgi:hypothetical protein
MAFIPKTSTMPSPDVYSVIEIAHAAGVPAARVQALVANGTLRPVAGDFFSSADAVAAVRSLRSDGGRSVALLFDQPEFVHARGAADMVSGAFMRASRRRWC